MNLEQQVYDGLGVYLRTGWRDGNVEPWDFTDIDKTINFGASLNGKQWGRPDDTFGIGQDFNGISKTHEAWFNAGGTGVLIGDGALTKYGLEKILETYYSYAITPTMKVSADYQFAVNPGYNAQRGPVSIFGLRFHTSF